MPDPKRPDGAPPFVCPKVAELPFAEESLADALRRVAQEMEGQPMTPAVVAAAEAAVFSILQEAYCRGEIANMPRPLAIALPVSHRLQIAQSPESEADAVRLVRELRAALPEWDRRIAWDTLQRRAPEYPWDEIVHRVEAEERDSAP